MRALIAVAAALALVACSSTTAPRATAAATRAAAADSIDAAHAAGRGCWIYIPIPAAGIGVLTWRMHTTPCPARAWLEATYGPHGFTVVLDR